MPPLNEGSLLYMPVMMPKTGLKEIQRVMSWQDQVIAATPEVESVAGKLGRFETATDPAPTEMLETTIMLKPEYIPDGRWSVKRNPAWREGMTVEKLKAELTEKMKQVPGYVPAFLQPIENRILMLYTGIRAQVGVKIYGDNLDKIQRKAFEIEKLINSIEGAAGVSPSRVQGKPYLNVQVDRQAMARYGLSAKDVLDAVEIAIGGKNVSTTIEGRQRFPIQIRVQRGERDDIEKLSSILVAARSGHERISCTADGRRWWHDRRRWRSTVPRRHGPATGNECSPSPTSRSAWSPRSPAKSVPTRSPARTAVFVPMCRPTCRIVISAASCRRSSKSSRPSIGKA
jgi:Cu(I)/Ag(I) efflux system membrane protein CusA/SilA